VGKGLQLLLRHFCLHINLHRLLEEDSSTVKAAGGFEELFFGVAEEDSATTGMTLKLFFVCGVEEVGHHQTGLALCRTSYAG
jgi:hypothetical protein